MVLILIRRILLSWVRLASRTIMVRRTILSRVVLRRVRKRNPLSLIMRVILLMRLSSLQVGLMVLLRIWVVMFIIVLLLLMCRVLVVRSLRKRRLVSLMSMSFLVRWILLCLVARVILLVRVLVVTLMSLFTRFSRRGRMVACIFTQRREN